MSQLAPTIEPPLDKETAQRLAGALKAKLNPVWEPRVASTGLRDVLVAVKDDSELSSMKPDMAAVAQISKELSVVGVHAFVLPSEAAFREKQGEVRPARESVKVRNFAPLFGIEEESATGTSNCALACALSQSCDHFVLPGEVCLFSQGDGMGQPSRITVRIPKTESDVPWVGGCFKVVAAGTVDVGGTLGGT